MAALAIPPSNVRHFDHDVTTSAPGMPEQSPIPDVSKSVLLLRDLILADQLPHFQASPEVKALLQSAVDPWTSEAGQIALATIAEATQAVLGLPLVPLDQNPSAGRDAKSLLCRTRTPAHCEDPWPDTFHNAIRIQDAGLIADPQPLARRLQPDQLGADRDRIVTAGRTSLADASSPDDEEYYSSQFGSANSSSRHSVEPTETLQGVQQYVPTGFSLGDPVAQKALQAVLMQFAPQTDALSHLPQQSTFDPAPPISSHTTQAAAGRVPIDTLPESDYEPPSGDSGESIDGDYDPTRASFDVSSTSHSNSMRPMDMETKPPLRAPPLYPPTAKRPSASPVFRDRSRRLDTYDDHGPPSKRHQSARSGSKKMITSGSDGRGHALDRTRSSSTSHTTQMPSRSQPVVRRDQITNLIPPPPDLAAMQALSARSNQLQVQPYQPQHHTSWPAPSMAPPLAPTPVAGVQYQYAQYPTPPAVVYPPPAMAPVAHSPFGLTTFQQPAALPNPSMQMQGYTLVRDQFGNAWYARPVQPQQPPAGPGFPPFPM